MRNDRILTSVLFFISPLLPALSAGAQAQVAATQTAVSTSTSTSQPVQQHLTATVAAVAGLVQYREDAGKEWKACTVGLTLSEGAEFLTGPHSNVQLTIPPKQTVTLDRLGQMKLLEAVKLSGTFHTDVGLRRGRVRYDIEAPGIEHESTVSSPNGTLAVRDTQFAIDDESPFPPEAYRLSGTVDFTTAKRTISMGGGTPGNVKAVGDAAPAETSLSAAVLDPSDALTRTPAESALVADVLSRGAVYEEVSPKRIPIVSGGVPPSDAQLPKVLPGALDFVVRWDGNANLDLGLINAASGETLYPATGINTSRSGGKIPFNDIGGPSGGIEFAYWNTPYPKGIYQIVVYDVSGVPVHYKIDALEHGVRDQIYSTAAVNSQGATTLTGTISAGQDAVAITEIGASLLPSSVVRKKIAAAESPVVAVESVTRSHR